MIPSRRLVHPAADDDFVSYISGSNVPSPKSEKKKKKKQSEKMSYILGNGDF